jgi:hypothetical protein
MNKQSNKVYCIIIQNLKKLLNGNVLHYQGKDYKLNDKFQLIEYTVPGTITIIDTTSFFILLFGHERKKPCQNTMNRIQIAPVNKSKS